MGEEANSFLKSLYSIITTVSGFLDYNMMISWRGNKKTAKYFFKGAEIYDFL